MPPLFVDGVEIKEVFIDGVEQDVVFADGVEVFNALQGEEFFDDFERSANGTPITSHVMNTGQSWTIGSGGDFNAAIQPHLGVQGGYSQGAPDSGVVIQAVRQGEVNEAMVVKITTGWNFPQALLASPYIEVGVPGNFVRVLLLKALNVTDLILYRNEVEAFSLVMGASNANSAELEMFFSPTEFAARTTIGGATRSTPRITSAGFGHSGEILVGQVEASISGTAISHISEFEVTPYAPEDVPWPQ